MIGVDVKGVGHQVLRASRDAEHEVWVSDISMFELLAMGAKFAAEGEVSKDRVALAVKAIMGDDKIMKVSAYGERVASTSIELRRYHRDFVDCLIVASALEHCGAWCPRRGSGRTRTCSGS